MYGMGGVVKISIQVIQVTRKALHPLKQEKYLWGITAFFLLIFVYWTYSKGGTVCTLL